MKWIYNFSLILYHTRNIRICKKVLFIFSSNHTLYPFFWDFCFRAHVFKSTSDLISVSLSWKSRKHFSILRASSQFIPSSLNWLLIIEQKMAQPQKRFIVMNSQWTQIPDHTYTKTYIPNISIVVYFKHFHFCRCWVYNLLFVWIFKYTNTTENTKYSSFYL